MESERVLLAKLIGEQIVSLRKDKNIRQEDLARMSGLEQRSLLRIEKGLISLTAYSLRCILQALNEDVTTFWDKVELNVKLRKEDK